MSKPLIKKSERGSLHREMGVSQKKTIPVSKLRSELATAKRTHNVALEKKVVFALNFRHGKK